MPTMMLIQGLLTAHFFWFINVKIAQKRDASVSMMRLWDINYLVPMLMWFAAEMYVLFVFKALYDELALYNAIRTIFLLVAGLLSVFLTILITGRRARKSETVTNSRKIAAPVTVGPADSLMRSDWMCLDCKQTVEAHLDYCPFCGMTPEEPDVPV